MKLTINRYYYIIVILLTAVVTPNHLFSQSTEIEGRAFVCSDSELTYSVEDVVGENYSWALSGGGTIISGGSTNEVFVRWTADENQGPFTLTLNSTSGVVDYSLELIIFTEQVIGLACNNQIQVSLDLNCSLALTPEMILEDMDYDNDSYEITLKDPVTRQIIPLGIPGYDFLDRPIEVSVEHLCSANSCWGNVVFEDKTVPPLFCSTDTIDCNTSILPDSLGFPLPDDVILLKIEELENSYIVGDFDPCSDITLSYRDESVDFGCQNLVLSGMLLRHWTAVDIEGRTSNCTDTIRARMATIADLIMPLDMDITLIACAGGFDTLANGAPDPSYSGSPSGPQCSNIYVAFDDVIVDLCGASFKVVREWTITGVCADEFIIFKQLIKVADTKDPIIECPSYLSFSSDKYSCGAGVDIPLPIVTDCSKVTFEIFNKKYQMGEDAYEGYLHDEFTLTSDSTFNIPELEKGLNWVIINVIDDCGNYSECSFLVEIIDDIVPVPVCDLHTVVSLDETGEALVDVMTFDDGSWDNCGPVELIGRRDTSTCSNNLWSETVRFCCGDLNNPVMVFLQVTDIEGNHNSCMVEVEVQDKVAPSLQCPVDMTLDCAIDIWYLDPYGLPEVLDNCEATYSQDTVFDLTTCGFGNIYRIFIAEDPSLNKSTCTQVLTLKNLLDPFTESDIIWPANYVVHECINSEMPPEELPIANAYPRYNADQCALISFEYEDKFFAEADSACYVILRSWWVIDACQYEGTEEYQKGKWSHIQKLKVYNNEAPSFADNCVDITISGASLGECYYDINNFMKLATDDCSPTVHYKFELDLFNNDTIDRAANSNNANGIYPLGLHRMKWTIYDGCANYNVCEQFVTVADRKEPTPYCIDGISTVVMEVVGSVEVWASDLNLNSTDDCTEKENLIFAFSNDINDNNKTYTCDDLIDGFLTDTVDIHVFDEAGNVDYCTTSLKIQDNGKCSEIEQAMISGHINSTSGELMPNVMVYLSQQETMANQASDQYGYYEFTPLSTLKDYSISLEKNDDAINGVTTLDLVLIQRHILAISRFKDSYQIIASDINNSGTITASDLLELRKLILGIYTDFPHNNSWRFVRKNAEFPDPLSPFPFPETQQIYNLQEAEVSNDFMGVKIGDVNGTVKMSSLLDITYRSYRDLLTEDQFLKKNERYSVPITLKELDRVEGLQFAFEYDQSELRDLEIVSIGKLNTSNYIINNGQIIVSWNKINKEETFEFVLRFKSSSNNKLSDVLRLSEEFQNEVYTVNKEKEFETAVLNLDFRNSVDGEFEGFNSSNTPNPFSDLTRINFDLAEDENVDFKVYDVSGNLIQHINKPFKRGRNEIQFYNDDGISGMLIYTLRTKTLFESKKMILIK